MKKVIAIIGTYRKNGVIDQAVDAILEAAAQQGCQTEKVHLIDQRIEFCTNCRACMQKPGASRGVCPQEDDMAALCTRIDAADALVIASPVNFYNVTAIMRRFMERLVCYGYWPWGEKGPRYRIAKLHKKAVLVTSSAMPAVFGRITTGAVRALKAIARNVGAKPVGTLFIGMAAMKPKQALPAWVPEKAHRLALKLVS